MVLLQTCINIWDICFSWKFPVMNIHKSLENVIYFINIVQAKMLLSKQKSYEAIGLCLSLKIDFLCLFFMVISISHQINSI